MQKWQSGIPSLMEGLEEWPQDGIEELLRAIDGKPQP
ncbi:MAG: hypothetical protein QOJ59_4323 [Thermomicrobiales bacterium]|jgi:hypothetical protein|nr:hypothetical protein [Thermomicrobiales bacterium]